MPPLINPATGNDLNTIFRPRPLSPDQQTVDLYHVYDNLSRTPFETGVGIQCEDPDTYHMHARHVITPGRIREHLDWSNRKRTQFISFYDNPQHARAEAQRRRQHPYVPGVGHRDVNSVRVAHVRLLPNSNVWAFSRAGMLAMMGEWTTDVSVFAACSHPNEWFVWGDVPEQCVENRAEL